MMKAKILTAFSLLVFQFSFAQTYPDFTITDTNGNEHSLYEDYLNQNKVVVIKLFFVACPPCNAAAPDFQAKNEEWGEGTQDVQFFTFSTQSFDDNNDVADFINNHSFTLPGAGTDGGGQNAVLPIINGDFGPYWGTPSYVVIAPDGSVQYPVEISTMNDAIEAAQEIESNAITTISSNLEIKANGFTPSNAYILYLKPANADSPKLNITNEIKNGGFNYPPSGFENIADPVIVLESLSSAPHPSVTASDLSKIQKHILAIDVFSDQAKILASDANGSGTLSASDLSVLQKSILSLIQELPNDVSGYFIYPSEIPLEINPGGQSNVDITVYRMGNVNF